jgi:hypothetical protein
VLSLSDAVVAGRDACEYVTYPPQVSACATWDSSYPVAARLWLRVHIRARRRYAPSTLAGHSAGSSQRALRLRSAQRTRIDGADGSLLQHRCVSFGAVRRRRVPSVAGGSRSRGRDRQPRMRAQPAVEARRQPVWRRQFRNAPNPHVRFAPACWAAWRGLDTFRPYIGRFVTNPLASLRLRGSASPARPDPLTQLQARSRRGPVGSAPPRGPCIACARRLQLSVARFRSYGVSRTKE